LVILTGPRVEGETFVGLAIGWWLGGVPALLGGLLSAVSIWPLYRLCRSIFSCAAIFLANAAVLAAIVVFAATWTAGLLG
jgi:hypothetical protein